MSRVQELEEEHRHHLQDLSTTEAREHARRLVNTADLLCEEYVRFELSKKSEQLEDESLSMSRVQELEEEHRHHLQDLSTIEARDDGEALITPLELLKMGDEEEEKINNNYGEYCNSNSNNSPKILCWRNDDQCAECMDSVEQVQELQEELKMVSAKLRFSRTQRQALKEVTTASATKLAQVMTENEQLKKELFVERQLVQARENDVRNLETRVEALNTSNQMLSSLLNLKKMALETTTTTTRRTSFNFATKLEPKLLDLAAMVSSQNACVVRLSAQNETLARSLRVRTLECEQYQTEFVTAIKQKDAAICALEQFKERMVEWASEMDERDKHFDTMQEYVLHREAELREWQSRYNALLQSYEELRKDRDKVLAWQAHARTQIAESEKALIEREKEVESISREALHLSLEVELLRRNLQQLDEDVMFKEGQISILRGRWEED